VLSNREANMAYAAIGIGAIGFAVGLMLRPRGLFWLVGLVLVASIAISVNSGSGFLSTLLTIMIAQTILQGSYFLGVAAHVFLSKRRMRHVF